jgi:Na+:H+ antiporter, NhaA family
MKNGQSPLSSEVLGGLALLVAAVAALLFVNLGGAEVYRHAMEYALRLGIGPLALEKSLHHWINDGFMVLFFLLIGIEINKEMQTGSLRDPRRAVVPLAAAFAGFIAPAAVYLAITKAAPEILRGWSIPAATDIAFALALIAALKNHVPASLRVFLLALAVADDLMAIVVIALFYTAEVAWMNLFLAAMGAATMVVKNRLKVQAIWFYAVVGVFMWLCVLESGVHATVAGVMIGLLLPLNGKQGKEAPADVVEDVLQPWVRWLVLPLFAFANVGVDLSGLTWQTAFTPLAIAIAMGLFAGKQLGVFGAVWALERGLGLARPAGASWLQVYGVACLCGIGFTMSLFIGSLALPDEVQSQVRLGVLAGSILSAIMAVLVLRVAASRPTSSAPLGGAPHVVSGIATAHSADHERRGRIFPAA